MNNQEIIKKYIDRTDAGIPFPELLTELSEYSSNLFRTTKARRVHLMCVKSGRISLADKIAKKYKIGIYSEHDALIAMAYTEIKNVKP